MAKHYCLLILIFISSCNKFSEFDTLYYNQDFKPAYELLQKNTFNSPSYQERELKVLLFLTIQDTSTYLPILDNALLKQIYEENQPWHDLAKSWIRFISASTIADYQNIAYLIPRLPFKDNNAELHRLSIQTHSLVKLKQYQEALAYLTTSDLTKNSSDLLYIQGISLLELKYFDESDKIFSKLLTITSTPKLKALSYFHLGNIAMKNNDLKKAYDYYFKSWEINPHLAEVNFQIGKLLKQQKYSSLHYRFYRASLRLNEDLAEAWYYLNI